MAESLEQQRATDGVAELFRLHEELSEEIISGTRGGSVEDLNDCMCTLVKLFYKIKTAGALHGESFMNVIRLQHDAIIAIITNQYEVLEFQAREKAMVATYQAVQIQPTPTSLEECTNMAVSSDSLDLSGLFDSPIKSNQPNIEEAASEAVVCSSPSPVPSEEVETIPLNDPPGRRFEFARGQESGAVPRTKTPRLRNRSRSGTRTVTSSTISSGQSSGLPSFRGQPKKNTMIQDERENETFQTSSTEQTRFRNQGMDILNSKFRKVQLAGSPPGELPINSGQQEPGRIVPSVADIAESMYPAMYGGDIPPNMVDHDYNNYGENAVADTRLSPVRKQTRFQMPAFTLPPPQRLNLRKDRPCQTNERMASPVCLCCIMFKTYSIHNLEDCQFFKLFTVDRRAELVKRWFICQCCLQYGHKYCNDQLCTSNCANKHHELLCSRSRYGDVQYLRERFVPPLTVQRMNSTEPPYCLCCINSGMLNKHKMHMCELFQTMDVASRNDLVARWHICYVCFEYGHLNCQGSIKCRARCQPVHHPVLCPHDRTSNPVVNQEVFARLRLDRDAKRRDEERKRERQRRYDRQN